MLPRTGRSRDKQGVLDTRKMILVGMVLVFIVYFAVVNVFFNFTSSTTHGKEDSLVIEAKDAHVIHSNTFVKEEQQAQNAANELTHEEDLARLEHQPEEQALGKVEEKQHSWVRNPDRKYVWIDVAIDEVYVGRITAELYSDIVPKTAENFRALTTGEKGPEYSYKNSVCHRILTGFIVQCGDYTTGKGYGGRSIYGGKFDDEPNGLRLQHSKRYILQMANSGPNTNGSQFCFMLGPAPHLNGKHVVFGEVVEGFEVVDKMEAAGVRSDGIPLQHKVALIDGGEIL